MNYNDLKPRTPSTGCRWWKKNSQKVPRRNCFELHGEMRDMNWPREKGEFMLRGQAI